MKQTTLLKRSLPLAAALSLGFALPSFAFTPFSYSGDTTGEPTFNRPQTTGFEGGLRPLTALSTNGTAVSYSVYSLVVDATNVYRVIGTQDFLGIQFLYENSFDPNTPLVNVINENDPFPDEGNSGFPSVPLIAGQQYFIVTTGFDNTSFGTFENTITLANPEPAAVPEPSALGGVAVFGMGCFMLKRKLKQKKSMIK